MKHCMWETPVSSRHIASCLHPLATLCPHLSLQYLLLQPAFPLAHHLQVYTQIPSIYFSCSLLNHFTASPSTKQFLNCTYSTGQFFASIFLHHLFFGFVCLKYTVYFTGHFLEQPFCVGVWVTLGNYLEVATVVQLAGCLLQF